MKTNIILEAIDNYDMYSNNQKKVLKTLVAVSVDSIAYISVNAIAESIKLAPNSTYVVLRCLENDGCITRDRKQGQKTNAYKISTDKVDHFVRIYQQKKKGLNQINK
jgi:predicted transcriptional regulator